jgi:hypothetical protein
VSGGNGRAELGEGLNSNGRGKARPEREELRAEDSAAIEDTGDDYGRDSNESEGEREGKEGETGEEITGSKSPLLIARGADGSGGIRGGGGARARARRRARREEGDDRWVPPVSESGGRARLSAARARAGSRWAAGETERERGREWAEPAQEGKRGEETDFF